MINESGQMQIRPTFMNATGSNWVSVVGIPMLISTATGISNYVLPV